MSLSHWQRLKANTTFVMSGNPVRRILEHVIKSNKSKTTKKLDAYVRDSVESLVDQTGIDFTGPIH